MLVQKKTRSILTPSNGRARVPSEAAHTPARDVCLSSLVGDRERRPGPHRRWGGRIPGGPRRARRSPGRRSRPRRERSADSVGTETVAETSPRSGKTALTEATRAGEVALARRPRHGVCPAGAGRRPPASMSRPSHSSRSLAVTATGTPAPVSREHRLARGRTWGLWPPGRARHEALWAAPGIGGSPCAPTERCAPHLGSGNRAEHSRQRARGHRAHAAALGAGIGAALRAQPRDWGELRSRRRGPGGSAGEAGTQRPLVRTRPGPRV